MKYSLYLLYTLFLWMGVCLAQQVSVETRVETAEAFVGESFIFQIVINGSSSPAEPDVSVIQDFKVESLGGQSNNSESITIINGQLSRVVKRGYFFSYRLTPVKAGNLRIPSLPVSIEGRKYNTKAISFLAKEPVDSEYFHLEFSTSKNTYYLGEAILFEVTWYITKDVKNFLFHIPVFQDGRFFQESPQVKIGNPKEYYTLQIGNEKIIAQQKSAQWKGSSCMTLSFQRVLIPKEVGEIEIEKGTVSCDAIVGYKKRNSIFDDDDDFMSSFTGRKEVTQKFVIPSNSLRLKILDLPKEGKPESFHGHIGKYQIETQANPVEVNVGTPITLTIRVSGPEYLENVGLPPLSSLSLNLSQNFKIPKEISDGKVEGNAKVFTQTIRALNSQVTEIPALELSYFDTNSNAYRIARSNPIPLKVQETKIITISDAEGKEGDTIKNELETLAEGIAFNYEDMSVLDRHNYSLATFMELPWLLVLCLPFFGYFTLAITVFYRRKTTSDPVYARAKAAYRVFQNRFKELSRPGMKRKDFYPALLCAIREYLSSKLRVQGAGFVYADFEKILKERLVCQDVLQKLKKVFQDCEDACYSGVAEEMAEFDSVQRDIQELAKELERLLS